jgi:hypothetical protein
MHVKLIETTRYSVLDSILPEISLAQLLPPHNHPLYPCLDGIDEFGDTFFNWLQIPAFLREWDMLQRAPDLTIEQRQLMSDIEALARRALDENLVLKFEGD